MPGHAVTMEAMSQDVTIEEGPGIAGNIAMGAVIGVGTAVLAWQAYDLGTDLYLQFALPAGVAVPETRAQLAALLWNDADKPAPEVQTAYTDISADDTAAQQAAAWAVEHDLMAADGDHFDPDASVSRLDVIIAWNKAKTSQSR